MKMICVMFYQKKSCPEITVEMNYPWKFCEVILMKNYFQIFVRGFGDLIIYFIYQSNGSMRSKVNAIF